MSVLCLTLGRPFNTLTSVAHTHSSTHDTCTYVHVHTSRDLSHPPHLSLPPSRAPSHLSQAYVDDALTVRVWVDLEQCKKLVDNITTIFHTTTPQEMSSSGSE